MHIIVIIAILYFLQRPLRGMRWGRKCGSRWGCYYFLFEKKIVKRFVQCHVLAQSLPGWRPSDKYCEQFAPLPIWVKIFHSQYSLEATVNHTQSLGSQIRVCVCVYTYIPILHNIETLVRKKKEYIQNELGPQWMLRTKECFRVPQFFQPLAMASRSCIYKLTDRRCTVPDHYYPEQSDDYVAEPPHMRFACRRISWQSMG